MGQIDEPVAAVARNRVRDTLLRFTWDDPQVIALEELAAHTDLTRPVAQACMAELTSDGAFSVTRLGTDDELRWRIA